MATKEFPLTPTPVTPVNTKYRKLQGLLPNPETVEQIERLRATEPLSMRGQPPIIWDKAQGFTVSDAYGNQWLDFSSGVLITNAGHSHPKVVAAIQEQLNHPLLTTYCFANQPRIDLAQKLTSVAPEGLNKVFLLSTGSEATECALKLMRTHGRKIKDDKSVIVSFDNAFHGRTMGSQMMGGMPAGKAWIRNLDPDMVQVPFPDDFRVTDISFSLFEKTLAEKGIAPARVAGVITETYQGVGPDFLPKQYAQDLRQWCDKNQALLCFDEVQAGFGRCGTLWGFELYEVTPDLFTMGKGFSSSLPISGVLGTDAVMDLYGPNEMTSTHSGNPICCAAALASLQAILDEGLVENSAKVGAVMNAELAKIQKEFLPHAGCHRGQGLVAGIQMVKPGTTEPDHEMAWQVINACFRKGLLMFAPVGVGGGCVKIAPPLCITQDAALEGCAVIRQALKEVC
ncbi:MAG: aspartate aminotransferase family protein [Sedimentisphaerales bacterium]|nr:aspartate aminotransferase family protein [Sedimentisphaerales bacterium]